MVFNIYIVNQLIDDNGRFYSFFTILQKIWLWGSLNEYNIVFNAIPGGTKTVLKGEQTCCNPIYLYNTSVSIEGILITDDKFNNLFVRNHINRKSIPASSFTVCNQGWKWLRFTGGTLG